MQEEHKIIRKCLKGNPRAQKTLYELHKVKWFMICLRYASSRMEAEDMLQEGLISIFKDLRQYDPGKATFSAWSNKVMVNAALQHLRKWKKLNFNDDLEKVQYHEQLDDDVHGQLGVKEINAMVQSLPEGYRVVFNLYVMEGYKHKEIADMLSISENTSKTQLLKAKRMLRGKLETVLQH